MQIETFSNKEKLREFITSKTALQQKLKGLLQGELKGHQIQTYSIEKLKRQPTKWEKTLISNTQNRTLKFVCKKINHPIKKQAKNVSRYFPTEDIQMSNQHMKRCLA